MSFVHVVACGKEDRHDMESGAHCWCEPYIHDFGVDQYGAPARVVVHGRVKVGKKFLSILKKKSLAAH